MSAYERALDEIYRSYMGVKARVEGRPDRDVRDPRIMTGIARRIGIVPPPERVLRVTGSKGKGTTTRLAAAYLGQHLPGEKIALFVSPEEFEHTDRMSIDGVEIAEDEFVATFERLKPLVQEVERGLAPPAYISPLGYFLLIALDWFHRSGATRFVLECGRGVRFDDVGQLASAASAVTSILLEHPGYLGPAIADIAADKLFIAANSDVTLVSAQAHDFLALAPVDARIVPAPDTGPADHRTPRWVAHDDVMARALVSAYLGRPVERSLPVLSPSFGQTEREGRQLVYEAAISAGSLDSAFLDRLRRDSGPVVVLASLPDDKDRDAMIALLRRKAAAVHEVALSGTRGYLHYARTLAEGAAPEIHYGDVAAFGGIVRALLQRHTEAGAFYFVGTQTYIRLVKRWLRASA